MKSRSYFAVALIGLTGIFAGCESSIRPMQDLKRVELWLPDDGSPAIQLSKPTPIPRVHPTSTAASQSTTIPADVHPVDIAAATQTVTTTQATTAGTQATAPATQVASTQAATLPATTEETQVATENLPPGQKVVKIIDPNQTTRFVYNATYDNIWQQSMLLLAKTGFILDREDYRLGVLTTQPLPSAQVVEFWKPQHAGFTNAMENTVNCQRRSIRVTISKVPGKPKFYEVAIQVLVERETNPTEALTGPLFVEGSGFGRNAVALRSDYADASTAMAPRREHAGRKEGQSEKALAPEWHVFGHDTILEKKLLDQLFERI